MVPFISLLIRAFLTKEKLKYYSKQGLPTYFFVDGSEMGMFTRRVSENKNKSILEFVKKVSNASQIGAIVSNGIVDTRSVIYIFKSDLIKEYLMKEDQFHKMSAYPVLNYFVGLFFKNGEDATHQRALFQQLFAYDDMNSLTPVVCQLMNERLSTVKEGDEINVPDVLRPVVNKLAEIIIFGKESDVDQPDIDEFNHHSKLTFDYYSALFRNILFVFMPNLSQKLGLVKEIKDIRKHFEVEKAILSKIIKRREQLPELSDCAINRVIKLNREKIAAGLSHQVMNMEELAGSINLFYFAGTDTSIHASTNSICYMSDNKELQEYVLSICKEIYDDKGFTEHLIMESNYKMNLWFKEVMRISGSIQRSFPRVALSEVKFKDFTVKKGDIVTFLQAGLNFDKTIYENSEAFDKDRYAPEKEKSYPRYQCIPFSIGKRICIGKHLGEMMVKLQVTGFVRTFEFEKPSGHNYKDGCEITYFAENPIVKITKRRI